MKQISVIGGGFAGMTLALQLAEQGFSVDLFEKSHRLGGLLGTEATPWGPSEQAANALIRTELSDQLCRQLDIAIALPKKSARRRFFFRDFPRRWPLGFGETWELAKRFFRLLVLEKKSLKPVPGQTLKDWAVSFLGPKPSQYLLEPALQGIYANELSDLSASLVLSFLFKKTKPTSKKYRGLITGKGGMQDLINALEKALCEKGVRIHLNSTKDLGDIKGPVVLAVSAAAASALTQKSHLGLSEKLKDIRMSSLISTTLFFEKAQKKYQGFGCLIPRGLGFKSLGVLMNSNIFKGRDQFYSETWILGGRESEYLFSYNDSELLSLMTQEREKILGDRTPVIGSRIHRWQEALPTYDTKLEEVLNSLVLPADLYLHGNYLAGIGLSKILERSHSLAKELSHKYA